MALGLGLMIGGGFSALALTPGTSAQIPYRGQLQQNGVAMSGAVGLHFYLYPDDTTTTPVWDEAHAPTLNPGSELVTVTDGAFSGLLGSYVDIEPSMLRKTSLYLVIGVIGDDGNEVSLAGRQLVGAAPFAWGSAPGEDFSVGGNICREAFGPRAEARFGSALVEQEPVCSIRRMS